MSQLFTVNLKTYDLSRIDQIKNESNSSIIESIQFSTLNSDINYQQASFVD